MDNKFILGSVVVVAVIAIIGVFTPGGTDTVVERVVNKVVDGGVGSVAGPDVYDQLFLHDGVVIGGNKLATTTADGSTFTAQTLCNNRVIVLTPAAAGSKTVSVASSSEMFNTCLRNAGDSIEVFVDHATTTGTNDITFADSGVNTDHLEEEGATTVLDVSESAWLRFQNLDGTTMTFEVEVRQAAD